MKNHKSIAIKLTNISKRYIVHHEKPTLAEKIIKSTRWKSEATFWALKNINLEIKKGERLGIIGPNGSGKTTLLKIIAGITTPTSGRVETQGKIVSLIDLEAGFHPDLTGVQNIYLNGMLLGMRRREIDCKLKNIINFADIGQFIDTQLYTYSSGMKLRLGFAIAVHADLEILILDENITFGDEFFRKKLSKKVKELFKQNKTIIIVSQWLEFLKNNCGNIMSMERGEIIKNLPIKKNNKMHTF